MENDNIESNNSISTVELKSKELSGLFTNNIISTNEDVGDKIKINLSDNDIDYLKEDLMKIAEKFPQLLRNIEIQNNTPFPLNITKVIGEIYNAKETITDPEEFKIPSNITIASTHEEDFKVNFPNISKKFLNQTIGYKNIGNNCIELPYILDKIPNNIKGLIIEGFDVSNLDISNMNLETIVFCSELTKNINKINGLNKIGSIEIDGISSEELDKYLKEIYIKSTLFELILKNQFFFGRNILEELAQLESLTTLKIQNSKLNNVNGIEKFNGKLKNLSLTGNDLDIEHLQEINRQSESSDMEYYLNNNSGILKRIQSVENSISNETYQFIAHQLVSSGEIPASELTSKSGTIDNLLYNNPDIPYYIKDANTIRGALKITNNPMMLENDEELKTFNFEQEYLKGGNLLLTIPQMELLLQSKKTIPQNIILKIESVADISSDEIKNMYKNAQNKGINLEYVQIFDKNTDNKHTQIAKYSISEYVYIRDTLDSVVDGIDKNEPDIDKFATVYMRLADSIAYDFDATRKGNAEEKAYYNKVRNSSRNLLNGLKDGKCVCAGYADILRNALSLVGVDSRINSGLMDKNNKNSGHAWNQVKIDGKWYYTDLTWDRRKDNAQKKSDQFKYMLMGKNDFIRDHQYTKTQNIERVEETGYDRRELREALKRAEAKSKGIDNFNQATNVIIFGNMPKVSRQYSVDNAGSPYTVENDNASSPYAVENDNASSPYTVENDNASNSYAVENDNASSPYAVESDNASNPYVAENTNNFAFNNEKLDNSNKVSEILKYDNQKKGIINGIKKIWGNTKKFIRKAISPISKRIEEMIDKRRSAKELQKKQNNAYTNEKSLKDERNELLNRVKFDTTKTMNESGNTYEQIVNRGENQPRIDEDKPVIDEGQR